MTETNPPRTPTKPVTTPTLPDQSSKSHIRQTGRRAPSGPGFDDQTVTSKPEGSSPANSDADASQIAGQAARSRRLDEQKSLKSGNSIVPPESIAVNALSLMIGIMAFLASLTLGAVIMVNQAASDWQTDISREVTIQIKPFDNVEMDKAIQEASAIALAFDGVDKVTPLDSEATQRLLSPWLGTGLDLNELPIPRLLTVTLAKEARPDFAAMRKRLEAEVPGAVLDDHAAWVGRLNNMAFATVLIGIGIMFLVLIATILTVVFATRGAMASNREVVEVLHFVGADNNYIASQFQRHFLLVGLKGSLTGAALAMALFYTMALWSNHNIATPEGDQIIALFGTFSMGFAGYFGIFLLLFLIAGLTAVTSRITVFRYAERLHRYGSTRKN